MEAFCGNVPVGGSHPQAAKMLPYTPPDLGEGLPDGKVASPITVSKGMGPEFSKWL